PCVVAIDDEMQIQVRGRVELRLVRQPVHRPGDVRALKPWSVDSLFKHPVPGNALCLTRQHDDSQVRGSKPRYTLDGLYATGTGPATGTRRCGVATHQG